MGDINDVDEPPPFCGDPLWDEFRPLYNSSGSELTAGLPTITQCFQHTVLVGIPVGFFWLLYIPLLIQIKINRGANPVLPWTTIMSMKWLIAVVLLCDKTFLVLLALWERFIEGDTVPQVEFVSPAVQMITLAVIMLAANGCRRSGIRSSGILFNTWLIMVVCGGPEFYSWIRIGSDSSLVDQTDFFRYIAYLVWYLLVIIQFILHCFSDPLTIFADEAYDDYPNCPEMKASFLNQQILYWFGSLITKGNNKLLEVDDLFELKPDLTSEEVVKRWYPIWDKELIKYQKDTEEFKRKAVVQRKKSTREAAMPLLESGGGRGYGGTNNGDAKKAKNKKKSDEPPLPSLMYCLLATFKWELMTQNSLKFISDLLLFANPIFLDLLISYTEDPTVAWQIGLLYVAGLFAAAQLKTFLVNEFFMQALVVGSKVQTLLTAIVYEKTLKLSSHARREKTAGEIVNLMAIDVERFKMLVPQLQMYWSSPFQISLTLFMLYQKLGWAAFMGVLVMLSLIPLNIVVSKKIKGWQMRMMELKDERIKMCNEVLSGIKVIKLYGWEPAMEKTIDDIRNAEMDLIRKSGILRSGLDVLNVTAPFAVALVTFATYTLSDPKNVLAPQVAFVSLTLFNQLRGPLMMAAELINQTVQAVVSNQRLKEFLVADELRPEDIDRLEMLDDDDVKVVDAQEGIFSWGDEIPPTLEGINMDATRGQLLAVVGRVGSAKSSLLSALLGEMRKLRGYIGTRGTVAYMPQQPWIQNATVRDNILMGMDFDSGKYNEIVEACALRQDFILLADGDRTEIGEKGINLSGGQKSRVALARACYQDRDVYLLDDPLSAVDAHVARHIFDKVIGPNGILRKKTRLFVTHGLTFLKDTDKVVIMQDGSISHVDKFEVLVEDESVSHMLKEVEQVNRKEDMTPSTERSDEHDSADDEDGDQFDDSLSAVSRASRKSKLSVVSRKISQQGKKLSVTGMPLPEPEKEDKGQLIAKEAMATGHVKASVYFDYIRSMGIWSTFIPFIAFWTLSSIFQMSRAFWVTAWSNDNIIGADPADAMPLSIRLIVYAIVGILETLFLFFGSTAIIYGMTNASINLHRPLLHNIFRSPLAFFDVTPLGRILNRIGKDMETIDLRLGQNVRFCCIGIFNLMQTFLIISISEPIFIAFGIPMIVIYILILRYYISSARQLQRLSSVNRSPIYSHFGETIQGVSTIRAFGWSEKFILSSRSKVDTFMRCSWFYGIAARWLGVRLETLGNGIILVTSLLAVASKAMESSTAGVIGLSVSYSLNVSFMMNLLMTRLSELETSIVSVERVKEYSEDQAEADWRQPHRRPKQGWPSNGAVHFKNYETRYRPGLELVIKGIDCKMEPGEKVGVVGRTGAGKSSLTLALFRIIEPASGTITIDDVDITTIGLHDLREKLSIIPQEPVLFSGTLRFNVDPTGLYTDEECWAALKYAHLEEFVERLPGQLMHSIEEGGENISVGQRQLVCLARAILRRSQVLILDEATAAVDTVTDALIQKTIRDVFVNSTVITIAHRLNTIMDYDKIMVMDDGRVAEYDSPDNLLQKPNGIFYGMAKSAKII
ncbi:mrp-3 [Pristionchus pacificus]|nr:mrp-3 [Pristionchus pacificus]